MSLARYLSKLGALLNSSGQVPAAGLAPDAVTNGAIAANSIALSKLARVGTAGHILTSNGTGSDPSYQAPPSSTPTTAQVLSATAGATALAVGTYCFCHVVGGAKANNSNYAGSTLQLVGIANNLDTGATNSVTSAGAGSTLSGTWKCMSIWSATYYNAGDTLFLRVA